ncbi:hypothetical protein [Marivirga harenae]|uniref:hypothetical protein n=1 Tax=Marivirga harenae TaxID=2010992 RepID=UPI0026DEE68F|nr:hypothetical protein [Marivirga harenae]WKV12699.1 hypothetical protein Q3Y49_02500 [Marivirga harenae]|tara:strand:+ start:78873 stop:79526 length:654 start_codon:yes stop_codon:yes gene_type:complete
MKTKFTLLAILFLMSSSLWAFDPAYNSAMEAQLKAMNESTTPADFKAVANGFTRIAQMNPDKWLPDYYAALAYTRAGFILEGNKNAQDDNFKLAEKVIDECIARTGENAELVALKGFALMGELAVDPQTRGQQLSGLVMQAFGRALKLEPENPRAMAMMAQMQLGMARFFGEGPEKACSLAKQSLQYFENEGSQDSSDPFAPKWGKESAEAVIASCK